MQIRSFEEFLSTKGLTVNDMIDYVEASGNSRTFDNCMEKNHCYGLIFSSIIIFTYCPKFTNREWNTISIDWNKVKGKLKDIPFWSDKELLKNLNKREFNEELL